MQTLEAQITGQLNEVRNEVSRHCLRSLLPSNAALVMAQCGAKGSPINIA